MSGILLIIFSVEIKKLQKKQIGQLFGHYTISSGFGPRKAPTSGASSVHSGVDIPAPEGTKLVCIMDGEVISLGWRWCRRIYNNNKK